MTMGFRSPCHRYTEGSVNTRFICGNERIWKYRIWPGATGCSIHPDWICRFLGRQSVHPTQRRFGPFAIRNFNRQMAQLAEKSLDSVPVNKRHASGITMGISEEGYHVLESEIEAFKERIVNIVNTDDKSEKVYQLNIQLFPLTKDKGGDNG